MSKNSNQKVDKHLRHRIITSCGDANAMMGTKHINPALCIYLGAYRNGFMPHIMRHKLSHIYAHEVR